MRLSERKGAKEVNLILIESGGVQHYCHVKKVSALLRDRIKNRKDYHCLMCMSPFTTPKRLEDHKKHCNGVNGKPTRIETPEEGKNTLRYLNFKKQMKAPFIIYSDTESLIIEIPDSGETSGGFTEKTERHEACSYCYVVVRCDGEVMGAEVYRGENAMKMYLSGIKKEYEKIVESLSKPVPIKMKPKDWENFKTAIRYHICEKSLIKDEYLDSIRVHDHNTGGYCGQSHKACFYAALRKIGFIGPRREMKKKDEVDKWIEKNQEDCLFCAEPLLKKNYRGAVKDHCHVTGAYRGAAHSECNLKLRINPKTIQIPVVFHNLKGYDALHIMQSVADLGKEVKCITNNMENYITFSVGGGGGYASSTATSFC